MKCEDALILISGHIDSMNTEDEENALQAHLSGCESCRDILRAYEQMEDELSLRDEQAPPTLKHSVMDQIHKETTKKKHRPWIGTAVAAALVLVVGLGTVLYKPDAENVPMPVAETALARTVNEPVKADPEAVAQRLVAEQNAEVAVVRQLYQELESCECYQAEGYVLYILPGHDMVEHLGETYGCEIYEPTTEPDVFYAILAP